MYPCASDSYYYNDESYLGTAMKRRLSDLPLLQLQVTAALVTLGIPGITTSTKSSKSAVSNTSPIPQRISQSDSHPDYRTNTHNRKSRLDLERNNFSTKGVAGVFGDNEVAKTRFRRDVSFIGNSFFGWHNTLVTRYDLVQCFTSLK
ncbi:hypothetical protein OSTOST_19260, partial [Ostertagia ostertagi]